MKRQELLERLAEYVECEYISDLRGLRFAGDRAMAQRLLALPEEGETLQEYQEVLTYIGCTQNARDIPHARQLLADTLCKE